MKAISKIDAAFNKTVDYLAYTTGAVLIFIMLSISTEVIGRKLWGTSIVWTLEVSEHAILFVTFLSAAWVLKKNAHVRVDVVLVHLGIRNQHLLNMATSIIGGLLCLAMAYWAGAKTWDQIERNVRFLDAIVIWPIAPFSAFICIGYLLLGIVFLKMAYYHFKSRGEPPEDEGAA